MASDQQRGNLVNIMARILVCAALFAMAVPLAFAIRDQDFLGQPDREGVITAIQTASGDATCASTYYVVQLSDGEGELSACAKAHELGDLVTVRESRGTPRDLTEEVPSLASYAKVMTVIFLGSTFLFGLLASVAYVAKSSWSPPPRGPRGKHTL